MQVEASATLLLTVDEVEKKPGNWRKRCPKNGQ